MEYTTILLQILATFLASVAFGINRQRAHKPIGFGTYTYVATGSCAIAITAMTLAHDNPVGLLSAVITGIGFLGAGALIRNNDKTFGFTTAAGLWLFCIFGLLIGTQEYFLASLIYGILWCIVLIDISLEKRGIGSYQKKLIVKTNKIIHQEVVFNMLSTFRRVKLINIHVDKKENKLALTYHLEGSKEDLNSIPHKLYEADWFDSCSVE